METFEQIRSDTRRGVALIAAGVLVYFGACFGPAFWIADLYNAADPTWLTVFLGSIVVGLAGFALFGWGITKILG